MTRRASPKCCPADEVGKVIRECLPGCQLDAMTPIAVALKVVRPRGDYLLC